jgi:hypothetical protein
MNPPGQWTCRDQPVAIRRENRRDLGKGERGREITRSNREVKENARTPA